MAPTAGESDAALLRDAVRALQRKADLEVVMGGHVDETGSMTLNALRGTSTQALRDLRVVPSAGLGGRVLALNRPAAVDDYVASRGISHDYDRPVSIEGLRTMLAVPVTDGRRLRMVLYGAIRRIDRFGDRTMLAAMRVAETASREMRIRAEVERRMETLLPGPRSMSAPPPPDSSEWDVVRTAHAELRQLTHEIDDPGLRQRISAVSDDLAGASTVEMTAGCGDACPQLSAREVDVLAYVGVGCTNAEVAHRLQILPETVKSYLSSAMRKLGAKNRHAAATAARRFGLLP